MHTLSEKLSVDSLMALNPCFVYPRERVEALVKDPGFLLTIPASDAYWALSRLLSVSNRVVWAKTCAKRAKGYAYSAAYSAAYAAAYAAYAAANAANAANARKAENLEAICHAVSLLEVQ